MGVCRAPDWLGKGVGYTAGGNQEWNGICKVSKMMFLTRPMMSNPRSAADVANIFQNWVLI